MQLAASPMDENQPPDALSSVVGNLTMPFVVPSPADEKTQWSVYTSSEKLNIKQHAFIVQDIIWGPACWRLLNALSFGHKTRAVTFRSILCLLATLLPCSKCKFHMGEYLNITPGPVTDESCAEWLVRFHNDVSLRCGYSTMSIEDVRIETLERLNDERGLLGCDDLWTLLLALACSSTSAQLCDIHSLIVNVAALLPWQAASSALTEIASSSSYASIDEFYCLVFRTRCTWAERVGESTWNWLEIVMRTSPLADWHLALGVTDELDLRKLRQQCDTRMAHMEAALQNADERVQRIGTYQPGN